ARSVDRTDDAHGPQGDVPATCLASHGDGRFTFNDFVNFSAGFGDVLLLGFGDNIRAWLDIGSVDMNSAAYRAGGLTGGVTLMATGVTGGTRAARAPGPRIVFSHATPARMSGPRSI